MSGYIKELLLDYGLNRLHVDLRSDLSIAIQSAFYSGVFSGRDFAWFEYYLAGYTAKEIADLQTFTTTEQVETTLSRIFTAIGYYSGYSDDVLVNKVERDKQYRRSGIRELKDFLLQHGQSYMSHDVKGTK